MKTSIILILFACSVFTAHARDFSKTEKIINSILNESSASKRRKGGDTDKKKDTAPAEKTVDESNAGEGEKKTDRGTTDKEQISTEETVLLKSGIDFFNNGDLDYSLSNFNRLLTQFPGSVYRERAQVWIAKIDLKRQKYNEAVQRLSTIKKSSPEYPFALFYSGESYRLRGIPLKAVEYFQKLASRFPDHELADMALLKEGKLYLSGKKGTRALGVIIRLIKSYPDRNTIDDAYYLLGRLYETDPELKDFETARRVYKVFIKKARTDPRFRRSPLLARVRRNLHTIEVEFFRMED